MASKSKSVSDQLRDAILRADKSRYQIAKETGLSQALLSRFVNHVTDLSAPTMETVAACIGQRIVLEPRPSKSSKRTKGK